MFIFLEGIRNLAHAKFASAMVMLAVGTAILTGGWFFIVTIKLNNSSDFFEKAIGIEVFLQETLTGEDIAKLKSELENNPGVNSVSYISKDSAAAIFLEEVSEDIRTLTGENPLPPSFRIRLKTDILTPAKIDSVIASFSSYDGVEDIVAQRALILRLMQYRKMIFLAHISIGIVIFIIAFLLITNTTRLSIMYRKKSIEVMKLVGSTKRYIRGPFIVEGFIEGFAGGIFSIAISQGFISAIQFITGVTISVPKNVLYYMIAAGCFLGIIGSNFAVRRFINIK